MIPFSCPNCGAEIYAAGQHAGAPVPCDVCGQAARAPSAVTDVPLGPLPAPEPSELPSAVVRPTPARGPYEDVFYDDGKALVSESQLIIGRRVYPLRHVVDVEKMNDVQTIVHRLGTLLMFGAIVCFGIAYCCFIGVIGFAGEGSPLPALVALVCLLAALAGFWGCISLYRKKVNLYGIGLVEKSGYVEEIWFRDLARRDGVFAALCRALPSL
jgi:hypothetical protein